MLHRFSYGLLANNNNSRRSSNPLDKVNKPCFLFAKGHCRFGEVCRYLHNGVHGKSTLLPRSSSSTSPFSGFTSTDMATLQLMLAKLGLNTSHGNLPIVSPVTSQPVAYHVSAQAPSPCSQSAQLFPSPHLAPVIPQGPTNGMFNSFGMFPQGVNGLTISPSHGGSSTASPLLQGGSYAASPLPQGGQFAAGPQQPGFTMVPVLSIGSQPQSGVHPTPTGSALGSPFHPAQLFATGQHGSTQATTLPNAFNTTTLQEPAAGNWNMDTGASSHLNDSVHCLSDILNECIYPSVAVGDGRFIPVTNSGHSILSTPFRPLRLNNVLITPHIVNNLISVRQFVRDNYCTVEFDPFGFSVKDFLTRRVLLRCDSTGDLYPVTKPSPIRQAYLTSQYTWHQRLGHPGSEVLRRLVSSDSISCTKDKLPVLCHACQLGKHVKLPFVSSSTSVTSSFDIVHSDLWTSPIPSLSGFKYYVFFSRSLFSVCLGLSINE